MADALTTLRAAKSALEMQQTGLQWYRGMMPEYVDGSDGEADAETNVAITDLTALIASREAQEPVAWADRANELIGTDWPTDTQLPVQPSEPAYTDSTPRLNVCNSAFEHWFQAQPFATQTGVKQMCRDSYAAGMGDPLVTMQRSLSKSL